MVPSKNTKLRTKLANANSMEKMTGKTAMVSSAKEIGLSLTNIRICSDQDWALIRSPVCQHNLIQFNYN